jgi:hypothetical protein
VVHRRDIFGVITDDHFFPSPQLAFHAAEKVRPTPQRMAI